MANAERVGDAIPGSWVPGLGKQHPVEVREPKHPIAEKAANAAEKVIKAAVPEPVREVVKAVVPEPVKDAVRSRIHAADPEKSHVEKIRASGPQEARDKVEHPLRSVGGAIHAVGRIARNN